MNKRECAQANKDCWEVMRRVMPIVRQTIEKYRIVFFHEPATFWRIFFLTTLILSIVGLKVLG